MANTTWGELSWSAGVFGGANDADVSVTGQSLTSVLNSVSISLGANVSLTGEQLSTSLNHSSSNSNSISPSEFTPTINTPDRMEAAVAAATQRLNNPNKNSIVRRNAELITYENSV